MSRNRSIARASETINLDAFLAAEGFETADAKAAAFRALIAAGLTRTGKRGMHESKLARARDVLSAELTRVCSAAECQALAGEGARVTVSRAGCDICGGSDNHRAVAEMVAACEAGAVRRLLIVGGTPRTQGALQASLSGAQVEVRFVSGTERQPSLQDAVAHCRWADLIAIWAPTPLPHKVSSLYAPPACSADRIVVHRRGVAALASEIVTHLARAS